MANILFYYIHLKNYAIKGQFYISVFQTKIAGDYLGNYYHDQVYVQYVDVLLKFVHINWKMHVNAYIATFAVDVDEF